MKRLMILGSVVLAGMVTANCANSREGASSASIMAPSAIDSSALVSTQARGGGKPGGGGTTGGGGSISLVMVSDAGTPGYSWGDQVTFTVSTTATTEPHLSLVCSQNGVEVYNAVTGYYASYPWTSTQIMTLSSGAWLGGAASCTAQAYYFSGAKTPVIGTLTFAVGA